MNAILLWACILWENLQSDLEDSMLCSLVSAKTIANAIDKSDSTSLITPHEQVYHNNSE
jgi:hypothetical protein